MGDTMDRPDGTARAAGGYRMAAPDLAGAHAAVMRILPEMCEQEWPRLLAAARLSGHETDPRSLGRLLEAMARSGNPVLALCARSLDIRLATYILMTSGDLAPTSHSPSSSGGTEVALLDRAGVIVMVNRAWHEFAAANGARKDQDWIGMSYLAACAAAEADDDSAQAVADAIRAATRGGLPAPAALQIPCHSLKEDRWFDVTVSSRYADSGHCLGATVTLTQSTAAPPST